MLSLYIYICVCVFNTNIFVYLSVRVCIFIDLYVFAYTTCFMCSYTVQFVYVVCYMHHVFEIIHVCVDASVFAHVCVYYFK